MNSPNQCSRTLHIHPTRRCNLRCLHCYSASSPQERDGLSAELLGNAIADASQQGYNRVSFSGGEPVLYQPLGELLEQAHHHQMQTAIVSNGMLLERRRLEKLAPVIDLLAISLDGKPETHNQMRANPRAFEMMSANLAEIRQSGLPFGFLFTLTRHNFRELDWVVEFALEQGASLLQLHPLSTNGRAKETLSEATLNPGMAAYVYFKVMQLQATLGDRLCLHLDLTNQAAFFAYPELFFGQSLPDNGENLTLAELISPLIIEADGTVVPVQHGFARHYAFGNLHKASLITLAKYWRDRVYPSFVQLCQQVYQEMIAPTDLPILDWHQAIVRQAEVIVS